MNLLPCICGRKAWKLVEPQKREVEYRPYWEYEEFWRGRLGEPVPWEK